MRAKKTRRKWAELSRGQRSGLLLLASAQLALAVSAWADLAARPASQVRGSKTKWALIIAINFVGPALYWARGIRR